MDFESVKPILDTVTSGFTLFDKIYTFFKERKINESEDTIPDEWNPFEGHSEDSSNIEISKEINKRFRNSLQERYLPFFIRAGKEFNLNFDNKKIMKLATVDETEIWDWTYFHSWDKENVPKKVTSYIKHYYCDPNEPQYALPDISTTSLRITDEILDYEIFGDSIYVTGVVKTSHGYNHLCLMETDSFLPSLIIKRKGQTIEYFDDPFIIEFYFRKIFDDLYQLDTDDVHEIAYNKPPTSKPERKLSTEMLINLGIAE